MKKLIHKYLTENYRVYHNRVCCDKAYSLSSGSFVIELEKIFGLTKKELKWYVKSWIRKQNKGFNFNDWWSPSYKNLFLPLVRRIFASTISQDLVSIEPLQGPTGQLFYGDYRIGIDPIEDFSPRRNIAERYSTRVLNQNLFDAINVDFNPIGSNAVAEMLNSWRYLINEQTELEYEQ